MKLIRENFNKSGILLICLFVTYFGLQIDKIRSNIFIEPTNYDGDLIKDAPLPLKMFYLLETYSEKYNIPKHIAYNIAYHETRYRGPFDWTYKHNLESFAGAVGPMQVMVRTASFINDSTVSKTDLKNDVELNIMSSMKLLSYLHKRYGDWKIVCGYYNTGRPIINDYAVFCANNKDYQNNWLSYKN